MEINKRYILASKIGNKSIINKIKWIVAKILNKLERFLIWIGYNWVGYKVDIKHNESEIIKLKKDIRALEICTTMAKNEYDNLKDSFNKYVLRKDNNNIDKHRLVCLNKYKTDGHLAASYNQKSNRYYSSLHREEFLIKIDELFAPIC